MLPSHSRFYFCSYFPFEVTQFLLWRSFTLIPSACSRNAGVIFPNVCLLLVRYLHKCDDKITGFRKGTVHWQWQDCRREPAEAIACGTLFSCLPTHLTETLQEMMGIKNAQQNETNLRECRRTDCTALHDLRPAGSGVDFTRSARSRSGPGP